MRLVFAASISVLATSGLAQDLNISQLRHGDLIRDCVRELDEGKDGKRHASELLSRSQFHLGQENQTKGALCLSSVYGSKFEFIGNRFVSAEMDAKRKNSAAEIARKKASRRRDYLLALIEVCNQEYGQDRFRALTTPACGEIFSQNGLPTTHP
ncbi:hypothetical protein [Phaeobacter sp. NW0010-22]|uniref:hypothetical protein n=1 Tax=Phaeobacter sp. NW0010-22 TaxID=3135907 RepID=UPI0033408A91